MMQNNVSLVAAGVTVFVLAIRLGWRGSRPAFGVMLGVSTLFFFELEQNGPADRSLRSGRLTSIVRRHDPTPQLTANRNG